MPARERRCGIWEAPWDLLRAGSFPAVFVVFSFTSIVDLIISLEEDGFISGFMEVYVREVPPHPRTEAAPAPKAAPATEEQCTEQHHGEGDWEGARPHPVMIRYLPMGRVSPTCAQRTGS